MDAADDPLRGHLLRQFDIAWRLAEHHFTSLTDAECAWRPSCGGPHVWLREDGRWTPDWPVNENYESGPPSIGWLTWHIIFWWSMVENHTFGSGDLSPEMISWPGNAEGAVLEISRLATVWRMRLTQLEPGELQSSDRCRWPFRNRSLSDVFAWANLELMKNASEIGYCRFLYAAAKDIDVARR